VFVEATKIKRIYGIGKIRGIYNHKARKGFSQSAQKEVKVFVKCFLVTTKYSKIFHKAPKEK